MNATDEPTVTQPIKRPLIFGYLRFPVLGPLRSAVLKEMEACAVTCGGPLCRVFIEVASPVTVLWSLLEGVDGRSGGGLVPAVTEIARSSGVNVRRMVDAGRARPARGTVAKFNRAGGGWLVLHSARELKGLGEPRDRALQRLKAMNVEMAYLRDSGSCSDRSDGHELSQTGVVIGQFKTTAFGLAVEVAKSSTTWHLNRAGLTYLSDEVVDLLVDLINRRMSTPPESGQPNEMVVQLVRLPESLVIEVSESMGVSWASPRRRPA